ncbi:MAG: hydroxyethylthiazole kinase [Planctomycetes bacterium]|nr:hydroxyethylthiazole kinase [Planctomycetota bacterium]
MDQLKEKIRQAAVDARNTKPLVGSVTNTITNTFVANAQLAVGGSAAMVFVPDESESLARAGNAFYINVGGIFPVYAETLPAVVRTLKETGKPWVLDPVAVGIGSLRTSVLSLFKDFKPTIIRGNASEIIALAGLWELGESGASHVRGVDSVDPVSAARSAAVALARWTGGAVAVSGATDLVTDGTSVVLSHGGSHFMEKITGAGCSLGGVAAVYAAVADPFVAALTATAIYNHAGRRAGSLAAGPGSFNMHFLDELYKASADDISNNPFDIEEATK